MQRTNLVLHSMTRSSIQGTFAGMVFPILMLWSIDYLSNDGAMIPVAGLISSGLFISYWGMPVGFVIGGAAGLIRSIMTNLLGIPPLAGQPGSLRAVAGFNALVSLIILGHLLAGAWETDDRLMLLVPVHGVIIAVGISPILRTIAIHFLNSRRAEDESSL